jgi:hypothetical protein
MLYAEQRIAQGRQKNYNCYEETYYENEVFEQIRRVAYWLVKFRNVLRGHSALQTSVAPDGARQTP